MPREPFSREKKLNASKGPKKTSEEKFQKVRNEKITSTTLTEQGILEKGTRFTVGEVISEVNPQSVTGERIHLYTKTPSCESWFPSKARSKKGKSHYSHKNGQG